MVLGEQDLTCLMRADAHVKACVDTGHGQLWFCGDTFGKSLRETTTTSDTISEEKRGANIQI